MDVKNKFADNKGIIALRGWVWNGLCYARYSKGLDHLIEVHVSALDGGYYSCKIDTKQVSFRLSSRDINIAYDVVDILVKSYGGWD